MNENIDLIKILKDCPKGWKFYTPVWGEVSFDYIYNDGIYIIGIVTERGYKILTKEGCYLDREDAECIFFPSKDQRDWSKFERSWDKPKKERFDVNTLQPFDKVLMRTNERSIWEPDFFGYKDGNWIVCVTTGNVECIPYNEETKHLVGTSDDCPEYYKWWEE